MKRTTTRSFSLLASFLAILLLTLIALGTSVAQATVIHSNVAGTTVNYTNITEGAVTPDPEPLYGQPFANGNSLIFTPTADFSAVSTSGGPADQTDGKLSFIVTAIPGFAVGNLDFEEVGLTVLNAPFGGDAFTSVLGFASIKVLAVSGVPVTASPTTHFFSFAPDSSFLHSADATGPAFATPWVGTLAVTLPDKVSKVLVTIDNHLYAATVGVGTGALIDKKGFTVDIDVDLNPDYIPEPGTLLLSLVGTAFIGLRRRG
jgi:hypothetical protein